MLSEAGGDQVSEEGAAAEPVRGLRTDHQTRAGPWQERCREKGETGHSAQANLSGDFQVSRRRGGLQKLFLVLFWFVVEMEKERRQYGDGRTGRRAQLGAAGAALRSAFQGGGLANPTARAARTTTSERSGAALPMLQFFK